MISGSPLRGNRVRVIRRPPWLRVFGRLEFAVGHGRKIGGRGQDFEGDGTGLGLGFPRQVLIYLNDPVAL
jgi:hypothetical protein